MAVVLSITGIDTDIGKTVVTGLLARYLLKKGHRVITQKICQTGCSGISEDIVQHRKIMGVPLTSEDQLGLTCPYVFKEPCSPHLAASLQGVSIDPEKITAATRALKSRYDVVLLEGVGGLMVPLKLDLFLVDYLKEFDYHHILVSSSRLGSINHTASALELLAQREIKLKGLVYNSYEQTSAVITEDTRKVVLNYLNKYGHEPRIVDVAACADSATEHQIDFSEILTTIQ